MSLKEKIAYALVDYDGWDFISALEIAHDFIQEVKGRPAGQYTYHGKNFSVIVERK